MDEILYEEKHKQNSSVPCEVMISQVPSNYKTTSDIVGINSLNKNIVDAIIRSIDFK